MVVNFSRTYGIYDYLFINGSPIERVNTFKYLGTFFDSNHKWQSNTDYICGKLKQRFYAFSRFKHFKPDKSQRDYFIASLIQPTFSYNIELWFNYATVTQKEKLLYPFERNDFYLDANFFMQKRVKKAALNFICDQNHVLNSCYETNRNFYRMPRTRTNRFLESFIPFSIKLLNN